MTQNNPHPRAYYPAFVNVLGRDCLVVGGGPVAERKALALIEAGARVSVVSPSLTPPLDAERDAGRIRHLAREFRDEDLAGVFLVVAATDDEDVNQRVARGPVALINVVDRPELCTYIVPSVLTRGPLRIAVSTSGAAPALARAIRLELEALYGPSFGEFVEGLEALRARALAEIADPGARERFLKSLATGETLSAVREGRGPALLIEFGAMLDAIAPRAGTP